MKKIRIDTYVFLIFQAILNIAAIITEADNINTTSGKGFRDNLKAFSIVALVAGALQFFSSIIFIIIPAKWCRVLFFYQLVIVLAFFTSAIGFYMEYSASASMFIQMFFTIEGINGIFAVLMLGIVGREGWKHLTKEALSVTNEAANQQMMQQYGSNRFQSPPPQIQMHGQPQYGVIGKQY